MQISKNNKIFIAGHKGMVGTAVVKCLKKKKLYEHNNYRQKKVKFIKSKTDRKIFKKY